MNDYDSFVASKRRSEIATGHSPGDAIEKEQQGLFA